ncbi:hypothetical protein DOTSEDRAFT_71907 [Dothistroma septosporum NZE10]|uniref:Uncharacterized protein n=1 Tax=Dothistroma septosporum (strain NZE10 / CBS 128990) TaxID=675120 RepID=N1PPC3_DOTSN|nr:hypothetical protein DOTSEDRAFT_71907 [Dothistroma septosporum NZE10]
MEGKHIAKGFKHVDDLVKRAIFDASDACRFESKVHEGSEEETSEAGEDSSPNSRDPRPSNTTSVKRRRRDCEGNTCSQRYRNRVRIVAHTWRRLIVVITAHAPEKRSDSIGNVRKGRKSITDGFDLKCAIET